MDKEAFIVSSVLGAGLGIGMNKINTTQVGEQVYIAYDNTTGALKTVNNTITLVAVVMVILTLNVRVNKNFVEMQILEWV